MKNSMQTNEWSFFCISCFFLSLLFFFSAWRVRTWNSSSSCRITQHLWMLQSIFLDEAWKSLPLRNLAIPLWIELGLHYTHPLLLKRKIACLSYVCKHCVVSLQLASREHHCRNLYIFHKTNRQCYGGRYISHGPVMWWDRKSVV